MNDNPHGWPQKTVAEEYNRWSANRAPSRQAESWTYGTRKTPSPAEEILSDAVAWWDVSTYREGDRILRNLGTGRDVLDMRLGSSLEPNTNDPIYLPVRDEGYVYIPAVANTGISIPDSDAVSFATDFDIMVRLRPVSWSTGSARTMFTKANSPRFSILSDGNWQIMTSADGSNIQTLQTGQNPSTLLLNGQTYWIRVTYKSNNAGFRTAKFYYAEDSINIPTSWIQIGNEISGALSSPPTLFNSTNAINFADSTAVIGEYYRIVMRDGYDGAGKTVLDADFTNLAGSTTSFNATGVGDSGFVSSGRYTLKGRAGEYLSTPNNTALNITTDLDIRARVSLDDWTPSVANTIVAKYGAATLRSYILNVDTSGALSLTWSADGTNTITSTSSVATGITDGAIKWVRATLDVDNGASGNDVAFYLSDDGATWTQLGTTITTAGTTSVSNNSSVLEIGTNTTGTLNPLSGDVYKVIIVNGIGLVGDNTTPTTGILVFSLNCEQQSAGTITFNAAGTSSIRNGGLFRPISSSSIAVNAPDTSGTTILDGDFDIKARVSFISLAGPASIIQKNLSPYFQVNANGSLQFGYQIRRTPGNDVSLTSTATFSFVPNTIYWVRVTFRQSDKIARFYTAPDSVSPPTSWTQLGSDVQVASSIRQFDPNTTVGTSFEIGSRNNGLNDKLVGSIYRLIIQKAFDLSTNNNSNKIFDMDFSSVNDGLMSFPESASSQTVTLSSGFNFFPMTTNGTNPLVSLLRLTSTAGYNVVSMPSRQNGGRPCFLLAIDDYLTVPSKNSSGFILTSETRYNMQQTGLLDVFKGEPFTMLIVTRIWIRINQAKLVIGRGTANSGVAQKRYIIKHFNTFTTQLDDGVYALLNQANFTSYTAGPLTMATLVCAEKTYQGFVNLSSISAVSRDIESMADPNQAFEIGTHEQEFYAAAFFRRALSVSEIETICKYYGTI